MQISKELQLPPTIEFQTPNGGALPVRAARGAERPDDRRQDGGRRTEAARRTVADGHAAVGLRERPAVGILRRQRPRRGRSCRVAAGAAAVHRGTQGPAPGQGRPGWEAARRRGRAAAAGQGVPHQDGPAAARSRPRHGRIAAPIEGRQLAGQRAFQPHRRGGLVAAG